MRSKPRPEEILAASPAKVAKLAWLLRDFVRGVLPEVEERAYPVWRGIGFRHRRLGYLAGIFPGLDLVRLAFEDGALLDDPAGLLRPGPTSQKKVRYVEVRRARDIRRRPLRALLLQSIARRASRPR